MVLHRTRSARLFARARHPARRRRQPGARSDGGRICRCSSTARPVRGSGRRRNQFIDARDVVGAAHPRPRAARPGARRGSGGEAGHGFGAPSPLEAQLGGERPRADAVDRTRPLREFRHRSRDKRPRGAGGHTDAIIKFEGCYHGHADAFLSEGRIRRASPWGLRPAGVTGAVSGDTLSRLQRSRFGAAGLQREQRPHRRAHRRADRRQHGCGAAGGQVLAGRGTSARAGRATHLRRGHLQFRASGGARGVTGVRPDLTSSKIIGGGLPVGAYGGRADLMDLVSPAGPVYQAGTLSGARCTTAGLWCLDRLTPRRVDRSPRSAPARRGPRRRHRRRRASAGQRVRIAPDPFFTSRR